MSSILNEYENKMRPQFIYKKFGNEQEKQKKTVSPKCLEPSIYLLSVCAHFDFLNSVCRRFFPPQTHTHIIHRVARTHSQSMTVFFVECDNQSKNRDTDV